MITYTNEEGRYLFGDGGRIIIKAKVSGTTKTMDQTILTAASGFI